MHIVAIIGSLRRASYNRMLYENLRDLLPDGVTIDAADISAIPLYNEDVLVEHSHPEPVKRLREQIVTADAVLFISPEYNFSMPGVLKNAIDWVSRPVAGQPFRDKPVAIMGATSGAMGTARMQYHLRQSMVFVEALVLNKPEVMVSFATERFDEKGTLVDEKTRAVVRAQLEALVAWTRRLRGDG